jgi:hypothetical protein
MFAVLLIPSINGELPAIPLELSGDLGSLNVKNKRKKQRKARMNTIMVLKSG